VRFAVAALCLLFIVLYIAPLDMRPLNLPDETRYAEIPREMLADGNWVVPRLCGVRYFEKPPMGYWLTATSIAVFGENRFAVRLPSALATGASAVLLALLVRIVTGAMAPALWSALIFMTIPFVFALGVVNVLDAPFATCITVTIAFAFLGLHETARSRRFAWFAAVGAAAGFGFLIKGFLAFVLPAIVICPFLLFERRWRELLTIAWLPLAVAAIVVLPWAIAVHSREPDYWRYFVVVEHVQRFLNPQKGQHPEPFWFLVPYLVAAPLVWTFLAPAITRKLSGAWGEHKSLLLLSVTWLVVPFLFFSASSGKLPTYILPCFAPVAVILGLGAWRLSAGPTDRLVRAGCAIAALVAVAGIACLAANPFLPQSLRIYASDETAKAVIALSAMFVWFAVSVIATFMKDARRGIICAGIAVVPVLASLHFVLPARALHEKAPERVLAHSASLVTSETEFFADGYLAPAICWQFKTKNVSLSGAGELSYGLSFPEQRHRNVTEEQIVARLADPNRGHDAAVVFFDNRMKRLLPTMPRPDETRSANGVTLLLFKAPTTRNPR
jgi:4-amino-4-deoxy-L-arabinose transferase